VRAKAYTKTARKGRISRITRPKILLVVGHPGIGSALETLLRIEDRYETRRLQSLDQLGGVLDGWRPDLALVDGVLVETGRTEALSMPAIVLSGNANDGQRLRDRLPNGQGWLCKDSTADDLRAAIERALRRAGVRGDRPVAALIVAGAGIAAVLIALAALAPRG
jgi:DNA-binding response OmpR family regulator